MKSQSYLLLSAAVFWVVSAVSLTAQVPDETFRNFETPQVSPLDLSPDGVVLAACNTVDDRVEIFRIDGTAYPKWALSIPVGVEPVTARFRTATELWVVNQLSDSISIVDLNANAVVRTIATMDEPADVVFAGDPVRAFVTCSSVDTVLAFDLGNLDAPPATIPIEGEDPRALAVSPDGTKVYAAVFESGNGTTLLGGGADLDSVLVFPPNVVSNRQGPYRGQNPPPNKGDTFAPPVNPSLPAAPPVGLIVKQAADGRWLDDNDGDWTDFVSGEKAAASGRPVGWELIDNDVAVIDTATLSVSYATRLMNLCMALAVNPATGMVTVVGTDATNEVRFEPVINGTFVRVNSGTFDPSGTVAKVVTDLNPHLDYSSHTTAPEQRFQSIGDPRGIAWASDGSRGLVTGMGSNNAILIGTDGSRLAGTVPVEVGEGPTGVVIDDGRNRAYVLNRFEGSISSIDLGANSEIARVPFFDPTPEVVSVGRRHLYDTHATSGLGQVSCASCHIDSRMDRLAWDLGDPTGEMKNVGGATHNLGAGILTLEDGFTHFHPMKGPMTTQTMQDIIGKEPHHWRGDRDGIEEFNNAFVGLLGGDRKLTDAEMQEFEDYLATIFFPPNPFRNLDNSLPEKLEMPGHYTTDRFGEAGRPLPDGNAKRALENLYRPILRGIDRGALACVTCHTLPIGNGTDTALSGLSFRSIPAGPKGERHHALVSVDGSSQRSIKVAQLRNLYDKVGCDLTQTKSRAGFGFLHDGSVDSLARFLSEPAFQPENDQEVADLVALMLAFSGSGFGDPVLLEPPGTPSLDVPAAVGKQLTVMSGSITADQQALLVQLRDLADTGQIGLILKTVVDGQPRGATYAGNNRFLTDRADTVLTFGAIQQLAASADAPVTFTAVVRGTGVRLGIDRDVDGIGDGDESRDLAPEIPGFQNPFNMLVSDATGDAGSMEPDGIPDGDNDFDGDGITNKAELLAGSNPVENLTSAAGPEFTSVVVAEGSESVTLSWTTAPGGVYVVEYSSDLILWKDA
ncbi:MAG: YncE family protein, partial [Verrucomicrobiales bacterium]